VIPIPWRGISKRGDFGAYVGVRAGLPAAFVSILTGVSSYTQANSGFRQRFCFSNFPVKRYRFAKFISSRLNPFICISPIFQGIKKNSN